MTDEFYTFDGAWDFAAIFRVQLEKELPMTPLDILNISNATPVHSHDRGLLLERIAKKVYKKRLFYLYKHTETHQAEMGTVWEDELDLILGQCTLIDPDKNDIIPLFVKFMKKKTV